MVNKMSNDLYLLSICIPTYNRCEYLKKTLDSIVTQKPFLDRKVEVVVSDNASTDKTEELLQDYTANFQTLIYYNNPHNDRDKNFPLVISRAHGLLRRLSNDTMMYHDGALEYLCQLVEDNKENQHVIFLGNGNLRSKKQILDFRQAIHAISYWTTYIACFCIWSGDCQAIEEDFACCDLRLWQVNRFYRMACQTKQVLVDDTLLNTVQEVRGKDISYGLFKVFYENYLSIISNYVASGNLTQSDYDSLEKDVLYHFFIPWTIQWEYETKNMKYAEDENLKNLVFRVCENKPYWRQFKRFYSRQKTIFRLKRPLRFIKHKVLHL